MGRLSDGNEDARTDVDETYRRTSEDYFSYILQKGMHAEGCHFPEVRIVIGTFGCPYFKKAEILEKKNEKEQEILFEFVAWNTHARTMRVALDTFLQF